MPNPTMWPQPDTYWRDKAGERQRRINELQRVLQAKDREIARLFKVLNETEGLAEEREEDLSSRLKRSKQVGDHLSKMLREARQRERDAEERADHLRDKLAQSTTRNIELGRQIETLSASVGDSTRDRVSNHATDVSDISEAITRYIDEAIEEHVVEEHVDD